MFGRLFTFARSPDRRPIENFLTWSFSGRDGRATFEWIDLGGQAAIRWRRIGGHRTLEDLRR